MDTKRLLMTMLIVGAVMLLFSNFFKGGNGGAPSTGGTSPLYTALGTQPAAGTNPAPQTIQLGDAVKDEKEGGTKIAAWISTATAGIDRVELNVHDYAQTVARKDPLTLFEASPGLSKPFSTFGIHLWIKNPTAALPENLTELPYDQQFVWGIKESDSRHVVLNLMLNYQGKALAEVTKTFEIDPLTYEVRISHAVNNLTDQPLKVRIDQLGPSEIPRDDPQTDDRYFHGAYLNSAKALVEAVKGFNTAQAELLKVTAGTKPIGQFNDYKNDPQLWIASSNRFFTTIVRPLPSGDAPRVTLDDKTTIPEVTHIAKGDLDILKTDADAVNIVAIVRLTGSVIDIGPGASVDEPLSVYMGPKDRKLLDGSKTAPVDSKEYARAVYRYSGMIQLSQGSCFLYSFCTSDAVVRPILVLLEFFKNTIAFGNYGIAIMILVIVVRAAMHPLTRASQINMAVMSKKMKDVQPQLEAAKRKFAENKKKQNEEVMRIYRENNVNPAGGILGCLPMLIQMPIWAALYSGLRTDIDLRHAAFIPGWINDLSHPDTILPRPVPLIGHPLFHLPLIGDIYGLNLLPLLLTAVFFINMKVTTASQPKPADEQQAQMAKMSQYMIFIFPLFLYSAPSGLNVYILASTLGGLVDTWLVRKTLKKRGILPASAQTLPTHEAK